MDRLCDFFDHQLSAYISDSIPELGFGEQVDDIRVPTPHFGCLVSLEGFIKIKKRLKECEMSSIVPPQILYSGRLVGNIPYLWKILAKTPLRSKPFRDSKRYSLNSLSYE